MNDHDAYGKRGMGRHCKAIVALSEVITVSGIDLYKPFDS